MRNSVFWLLAALSLFSNFGCCIEHDRTFDLGTDLDSFVSAPLLRPPIFNVTVLQRDKIAHGYWFLAPYSTLKQNRFTTQFEECQIGPAIFDNNGSLIWSGACELRNSNVFDFKTWIDDDNLLELSFILNDRLHLPSNLSHGIGGLLDRNFNQRRVHTKPLDRAFNMHEFTVLDGGKRAIMLTNEMDVVDTPQSLGFRNGSALAWKGTIIELELATGNSLFEWNIMDHVSMTESFSKIRNGDGERNAWDWIHPNSVDKNQEGDYLLSARFTDCIYKISGKDGSILWRLGGKTSSFVLDNFNFSRQHDARFRGERGGKTLISFLNNGADEFTSTSHTSAGYLVELDTASNPMNAKLVKQWLRPDGRLSRLRGNMQMLDNGNVFIGWSEQGYITEFDADGSLILEAKFSSNRFTTYRTYKLSFVSRPNYPPSVKARGFGTSAVPSLTAIYVSWNGATEVASWKFYGGQSSSPERFTFLEHLPKSQFETLLTVAGHWPFVYVEAYSKENSLLGKSEIVSTEFLKSWNKAGPLTGEPQSQPLQSTSNNVQYEKLSHSRGNQGLINWWRCIDPARKYLSSLITGLLLGIIATLVTTKMTGHLA